MILDIEPALQAIRAQTASALPGKKVSPISIEDADVVDRGSFSGDLSFLSAVRGSGSGDSPFGLSLTYGVAPRTEVSLGLGALSGSPSYRRSERDAFGDLAIGVKTQLMGGANSFALAYGATFLTTDQSQNDDLVDQSVSLVGSQTWGRLESIENLGAVLPGSTLRRATTLLGGGMVYDAGRGNTLTVQANRNQPQNALLANKLQYGAGITHSFDRHFSLEAQLGRSGRGRRSTGLFLGGTFSFGGG